MYTICSDTARNDPKNKVKNIKCIISCMRVKLACSTFIVSLHHPKKSFSFKQPLCNVKRKVTYILIHLKSIINPSLKDWNEVHVYFHYLSPPEPVLQPCDCTSGHKLPCGARAQGPRERACSTCPITSEEAPPPHRRLLPLLLPLLLRGDSGLFVPSRTAAAHLLTWHTDFLLWKVSTTNSVNGVGASERVPTSPLILPVSQAGRHRRITLSVDVRHEPSCCCCCCNSAERSHCTVCEREREIAGCVCSC